ncbi:MAG: BamA/TamA family outer membrane protein [Bacteroidota bacterium]
MKLTARLYVTFLALFLTGCLGTSYLKEDQKLLYKQKLNGVKGLDRETLNAYHQARPNRRLPLIQWSPYIDIYQMGMGAYDSAKYLRKKASIDTSYKARIAKAGNNQRKAIKLRGKMNRKLAKQDRALKEGNLFMRWGEQPSVFDSANSSATVEQFEKYLYSKGYFNAEVSYNVEQFNKLITVTYDIERSQPYVIDSIFFTIPDKKVDSLVRTNLENSFIEKGKNYEQKNLTEERERLNELMVNNGYYDFSRQYISFEVDSSSLTNRKVMVHTVIRNPVDQSEHKQSIIDSVYFVTDSDLVGVPRKREREEYNTIIYNYYRKRYSKKIIDWRLFLYPGQLYSKANTFETQRQLSNLDIYKFINVKYDTTGGQFTANVFTSPLKKFETSTEVGVNVSQGLPGPFVNASLKVRNIFRGLDNMTLSGQFGIEGVASATEETNVYSSVEYGANLSFDFPQFLFPLGSAYKSRIGQNNPRTRVTAGLNYIDRPEYLRNSVNTRIDYSWQKNNSKSYILTPGDFAFIDSELTSEFDSLLNDLAMNGNNLRNSFLPSFVSSSSFAVIYNFNNYGNLIRRSSYLRLFAEAGGNLLNVIGREPFGSGLEYYRWLKFNADFRAIRPTSQNNAIAFRINTGLAYSYGSNETLPYEKFFFAGGSNSIRAWRPRRLGPGSSSQTNESGEQINDFEQPGDIIIESSIEFRHKLFGFVNGALFFDAGNVWSLRFEEARPGSQFQLDRFYREIAIGGGYGVRFDFSFLLLRLDTAFKIYDPTRDGGTFIWDKDFNNPEYQQLRDLIINIGIGYPF